MPLAMLCHRGLSFYESALSSTLPRQPAGLRPCQIAVVSALTFELEPKSGDLRLDPTGPISISSTSNPDPRAPVQRHVVMNERSTVPTVSTLRFVEDSRLVAKHWPDTLRWRLQDVPHDDQTKNTSCCLAS